MLVRRRRTTKTTPMTTPKMTTTVNVMMSRLSRRLTGEASPSPANAEPGVRAVEVRTLVVAVDVDVSDGFLADVVPPRFVYFDGTSGIM